MVAVVGLGFSATIYPSPARNKNMDKMTKLFVDNLKRWKEDYEKKGFIPTLELLIEDLEKPSAFDGEDHDCGTPTGDGCEVCSKLSLE